MALSPSLEQAMMCRTNRVKRQCGGGDSGDSNSPRQTAIPNNTEIQNHKIAANPKSHNQQQPPPSNHSRPKRKRSSKSSMQHSTDTSPETTKKKKSVLISDGLKKSAPILESHDHDVLAGRGGKTNTHHGNVFYRNVIEHLKPVADKCEKKVRPLLARSVILALKVQNPPTRFLKQAENDDYYFELSDEATLKKVRQALREEKKESCQDEEAEESANNIATAFDATHRQAKGDSMESWEESFKSKFLYLYRSPRSADSHCQNNMHPALLPAQPASSSTSAATAATKNRHTFPGHGRPSSPPSENGLIFREVQSSSIAAVVAVHSSRVPVSSSGSVSATISSAAVTRRRSNRKRAKVYSYSEDDSGGEGSAPALPRRADGPVSSNVARLPPREPAPMAPAPASFTNPLASHQEATIAPVPYPPGSKQSEGGGEMYDMFKDDDEDFFFPEFSGQQGSFDLHQ